MADTLDPRFLDKRTAARYIRQGLLDERAYERHLKSLPDLASQALPVEADISPGMEDDDEGDLDESEGVEPGPEGASDSAGGPSTGSSGG